MQAQARPAEGGLGWNWLDMSLSPHYNHGMGGQGHRQSVVPCDMRAAVKEGGVREIWSGAAAQVRPGCQVAGGAGAGAGCLH